MKIINIFTSFFKIGIIGFGGGSALIPITEREIVEKQKALTNEQYLKHTVVANITPGALPVKLGATCGYQLGGGIGAFAGAFGVLLPGVLLTVLLMSLFSLLGGQMIEYFNYASIGITAFIIFLLFSYIHKTIRNGRLRLNILICAIAFAVTGGKAVRQILGILTGSNVIAQSVPLFGISTINLFVIAFFVILLIEKLRNRFEFAAMVAVCTAYAFCAGKTGSVLNLTAVSKIISVIMIAVVITSYICRGKKIKHNKPLKINTKNITAMLLFLLIPSIITLITLPVLIPMDLRYVGKFFLDVGISTLTSFGGGEAYISVADGIFVQGGYISPDIFYTRLVPIANALPGPILIKVAAGISYVFGEEFGGLATAVAMAAVATVVTMCLCGVTAIITLLLYDGFKNLPFIKNLKSYILPVICGMLLTTTCSMLYESMKIAHEKGVVGFVSLPAILLMIFGIHVLHKKTHIHDVLLLLASAVTGYVAFLFV